MPCASLASRSVKSPDNQLQVDILEQSYGSLRSSVRCEPQGYHLTTHMCCLLSQNSHVKCKSFSHFVTRKCDTLPHVIMIIPLKTVVSIPLHVFFFRCCLAVNVFSLYLTILMDRAINSSSSFLRFSKCASIRDCSSVRSFSMRLRWISCTTNTRTFFD